MTKANEVAELKSNLPVVAHDYGVDAGAGFENQTSEDYAIPFIGVLQALSPQVGDPSDGGIEGAKQGMLFNTVTNELFEAKSGLGFVPATTTHVYVEWVPRDSGGGFVGVHQLDSQVVRDAKSNSASFNGLKTSTGNDLVETFYVYGVLLDEEGDPSGMGVIAFTSSKIKVYKNWNTKVKMFTIKTPDGRKVNPPLFAHQVRLTSTKEKSAKGDYHNFAMSPLNGTIAESLLPPDSPVLAAAKQCKEMVEGGVARASYETQDGGAKSDVDAPF